jgi:peptide/nickel transport system substrate-binding protein
VAKTRICFALAGPALLMIVAQAGCARGGHVAREWDVPEQPARGGECVLALQADGRTLDPHRATDAASMRLIENMYSTLMRYTDKYGEIQPYLAEHVELSDDRLTYTFTLRSDARFHFSHRVMTSEDARYSIERIREQRVRAEQFKHIASIDTPDKHTLVITLTQPVAPFLTYLAYPMNAIVDREVVEKHEGRLDNVAGGTGPFRLVEWRKDRHLIMERHPAYHIKDLPYLDRVRWRPIPDETARVTALRNLEIDGMLDVPDKDRALLERTGYLSLQSVPGTFWEYVGLNTQRPPFDDARVRQAVAWAVDRDMINRIVKRGRATVADGDFFPPGHWAWSGSSVYPERNVARARDVMAEAGYAEGARAQLKVGSAFPYQVAAAQIVKQNLKEIGLAVDLLTAESSVFFDALGKGEFDMTLVGWLGFVDPDEWFYNIFHSEGAWNQQQYSNPDLDALLEQGRMESNQDRRREQYQRAQKMILKDAPVVLLYINEQTSAFLNRVQGYRVHPTATTLSLRETWLAPEQEE